MKLINLVITAIMDPNLYYSRFSFMESDKRAIDIKFQKRKGGAGLPEIKNKFNTRSALLTALIPNPSDGRLRAMFYSAPKRHSFGTRRVPGHSMDPMHKGHMFTIAANKINQTLNARKQKPVFKLNQVQNS